MIKWFVVLCLVVLLLVTLSFEANAQFDDYVIKPNDLIIELYLLVSFQGILDCPAYDIVHNGLVNWSTGEIDRIGKYRNYFDYYTAGLGYIEKRCGVSFDND